MDASEEEADESKHQRSSSGHSNYAIVALSLFMLSWQSSFKISDTCITALLMFLYHFFSFVGTTTHSLQLCQFARSLPKTIKQLRVIAGIDVDMFTMFVVCPMCHCIYDSDSCVATIGRRKEVNRCKHIAYPDHPHSHLRQRCNQLLMKTCKAKSSFIYRPFKVFCYQSIIQTLKYHFSRPNFLNNCEQWRNRVIPDGVLGDIYDGRVWKEFASVNGTPFLSEPYSLGFSLNVDWFQPFKHVTDSVGAIYISILNLPINLRYKAENIILCGIIPGPKEPKDLNNYFQPIIRELLVLWEGIEIDLSPDGPKIIRGALLCIASDLPATRKLCGFASHAASLGCSKCLKRFPSKENKLDFSGFERNQWILRDLVNHRTVSELYKHAKPKSQQEALLKAHGVKYSVLLQLPYFV